MPRVARTLARAARPIVVIVLVLAQGVSVFGFPFVQSHLTVKACGCVMPCGKDTDNCCCAKMAEPAPEPEHPRCPKCKVKDGATTESKSKLTWVAGFKARQCRGESPISAVAELPSIPPQPSEPVEITIALGTLTVPDSQLPSHDSIPVEPPPRCG